MESPWKRLLKLLVERDPASPGFWNELRGTKPSRAPELPAQDKPTDVSVNKDNAEGFALWHDVFVEQELPWRRFVQSALLHAVAIALIWTISISWIRQQKILDHNTFDRASLVTYTPQEYLPPLDTGKAEAPKTQKGDPAYAKQPILSVPKEADNRAQTIVAPPDLKLNKDVALPNIIATGTVTPTVPLDVTRSMSRVVAPETQVVAPAPDVQFARDRVVQSSLKTDIIAPPPEVTNHHARGLTGPETAVVEPPPDASQTAKSRVGLINIGQSAVVAPAPQLPVAEQHSMQPRGKGTLPGGGMQPVGPPPTVSASGGGSNPNGRLIALGIHPAAPNGPVTAPAGSRSGTFSANPKGKQGASGTPDLTGSKPGSKGSGTRGSDTSGSDGKKNGAVPAGIHVGAPDSGADGDREVASLSSSGTTPHAGARAASEVSEEKMTDLDRQVFHGKRFYAMTLNMPNLNSSSGSWVIRFAELESGHKQGELLAPVPTEKSDPGYPLELMRTNVHGMVTLYAVIHADGRVSDIKVLNSPDERLDSYAAKALARWKFVPAERAGKPVALEAVVVIPFKVHHDF